MEMLTNCPLCHSKKSTLFDTRTMHGHGVTNRKCDDCGFVFLSPRMTEKELDQFYKSEYRTLYQGQESPNEADLNTQQQRADHLLHLAKSNQLKVSRHLDNGSSAGILLKTFQDGYGCDVVGVEPGDGYRSFAIKQGLNIYSSLDDLKENGEEKFDLISMSHVLEHISDPIGFLSDLRDLLTEDGSILVEVPNLYGHTSFEISHLSSFSKHTLTEVFKQSGYEVVEINIHGVPRSKILPLYLTVIAKPLKDSKVQKVSSEKLVSIKRKMGMISQRILGRLFPKKAWLPKV